MKKKCLYLVLPLLLVASGCTDDESSEVTSSNKENSSTVELIKSPDEIKTAVTGDISMYSDYTLINLSDSSASINGNAVDEYDYTWHVDPSTVHSDVKNCPAEYFTGSLPDTLPDVYIDHELYYFPELAESNFRLVNYDGEQEWAYYYNDGTNDDFIFATLPNLGNKLPTEMMHSETEASANKVLHITKAGTYVLQGSWSGQVLVDLGDSDDTFADETAKVTLILNGANINCSVAPGINFYSVYECDNTWEEKETYSNVVDTSGAGANIVIADDSSNIVTGNNIYRMLKTKYKDETSTEEIKVQKKARKNDAALYSYVSMNINGSTKGNGNLQVNSSFEGLDSELHLTFNGGNTIITSVDDGSNVNEDNVSVWTLNGGTVCINASQGTEGDGVDSNGFVTINGGTLYINNVTTPDDACDSEDGVYYNDGTIIIDGIECNFTKGQRYDSLNSQNQGMNGGMFNNITNFDLSDFKEKVAALPDDATLEDVLELLGMNQNGQQGNIPEGQDPTSDENFDPNNKPDGQQGGQMGEQPGGQTPPDAK